MTKKLISPVLVALVLCGGCTATVAGEALPDPAATVTAGDTMPPSASSAPVPPADSPYVYGGVEETQGGTGLTPNQGPNDFGGVK